MNERIFELVEQAREFATTRHPVSNIVLSVNSEKFEEKFAELIVEACAQHVLNDTDRHRKEYFADLVKTTFWDK